MANKEPRIPPAENSLKRKNRAVEPVPPEKAHARIALDKFNLVPSSFKI